VTSVETRDLRGLPYGIRVAGDPAAPAVLLLHGFAGAGDEWDSVSDALVAAGYRTIAPDLPGHGRTAAEGTHAPARYGFESIALDLAALLDQLHVDRAHWTGYSMGGRLAWTGALAHPDRVTTLVLEGASPGLAADAERAERVRSDEALAAAIVTRGVAWFADSWAALPIFESQRALPDAVRAGVAERRLRNRAGGLSASLRAAGQGVQPYVGDWLGAFPHPVLLVTGALDTKYVNLAAAMAPRFPSSLHLVAPGAGHNVHLEQPEWFVRSLLTHLRRSAGRVPHGASATP
jgi:2-succinyl-6-hydroxy-2,4-cyclohexadiene-1-carboxylate synthase